MAQPGDEVVLLPDGRAPVGEFRMRRDAGEARRDTRVVQRLRRADERLRRHAADIDASAADRAVADQCDIRALLDGGDRGRERSRTGTDDDKIVGTTTAPARADATARHWAVRWCSIGRHRL